MRRNNKILIPIIILLLAVTIAVVVVLVVLSKNQKGPVTTNEVANTVANSVPTPAATTKPEEEIDLSNVDKIYQDIAIAFADGLSSEKKMDTFKEKYFDPIAFVAYSKMDNIEDFLTLYEAVEETETDKISTALTEIISKNNTFEVIKMTDVKENSQDKDFTTTDVTIRDDDGKVATFKFTFYGEEVLVFIEDGNEEPITNHSADFSKYFVASEEDDEDDADGEDEEKPTNQGKGIDEAVKEAVSKMAQQEIDIYNSHMIMYEGESIKGAEVKSLIDVVISSNEQFSGVDGKFVAVYAELEGYENSSKLTSVSDLASFMKGGSNSEANVKAATIEYSALKSKINSSSNYSVQFTKESGLIVAITIKDA